MKETWRDILGFEGLYRVSSYGRVESCAKQSGARMQKARIMVQHTDHRGYWVVWLRKNATVHKKSFAHRLVALAFIPNPDGKPIVNHIDGNRKHNCVSGCGLSICGGKGNLEWATDLENVHHGIARRGGNLASLIPF